MATEFIKDFGFETIKGEIEMATKTMEIKENLAGSVAPLAAEKTVAERLRQGPIDRSRITAERRGLAQNSRLLACLQLSQPWHDLPARQSPAAGAPQARAHQEPAAWTLGSKPRSVIRIRSFEPLDQDIRPGHDLHGGTGARRARSSGTGIPGGHLL